MSIQTDIEVTLTDRNRVTAFFRLILVLPILFWLASISPSAFSNNNSGLSEFSIIGASSFVLPIVLSLLFTGQYPSYLLTLNHALLELQTRIAAYVFLLTDRYPTIERNDSVAVIFPDVEGGKLLSRGMPLVKWFLAIPLYFVAILYYVGGVVATIIGWFSILFTGKLPESVGRYLVDLIAFSNNVSAYAFVLVTDKYPSFRLGE